MPLPFEHILLATEGSPFDVGAERIAVDLAATCGVPLLAVIPVFSNPEFQIRAPGLQDENEALAVAKLEELGELASARGVDFRWQIRLGETPFREIVAEARKTQADLIVLRRHRRHGYLANLLLGDMVHTVTAHTNCDVLVVPPEAHLWSHGIVLGTDGSPHSDRAGRVAAALAVRFALPLSVVSAAEPDKAQAGAAAADTAVDRTLRIAHAVGAGQVGCILARDKPHRAILSAAQQAGSDLIVVGRRGLGRMQRLLVGSTSEQVAGSAGGPVLIVQQTPPLSRWRDDPAFDVARPLSA